MGRYCLGERKKKRAVIDWRVSNHSQVCSNITGGFGEALQDASSDSGEQGIISDSRKKIKGGKGKLQEAKINKFGKTEKKRTKKGRNAQRNNKDGKWQGKLG